MSQGLMDTDRRQDEKWSLEGMEFSIIITHTFGIASNVGLGVKILVAIIDKSEPISIYKTLTF